MGNYRYIVMRTKAPVRGDGFADDSVGIDPATEILHYWVAVCNGTGDTQ
jgi:hypothetical protein